MRLYESAAINAEEVLLFSKIDALQDPKFGGCWASNTWLANWWHKSDRWVSLSIGKLHKLGLVRIIQKESGRVIQTLLDTPQKKTSTPPEENFCGPQKKTSAKVPLREGESTRAADRPVADTLLSGVEVLPDRFSPTVVEFANWSRRHGFHVRVPGAKPIYAKGGGQGGWSRLALMRWEEAYQSLCARHGRDRVGKTAKRFIRWHDSEYAPVIHTFTSFAEKFDRIHKFVEREKAIREKNGEDTDDLDFPEVRMVTINKGPVKTMTEEEHRKLRAEVE